MKRLTMSLAAALAVAALTLTANPSWANTTSGMVDGSYAAQLSASIYMRDSSGYTRVCIQITGSGGSATGTIKARRHDGTWEAPGGFVPVTLTLVSGRQLQESPWRWGTRPTNWNGLNRGFNEQHGWNGYLTPSNRLRVGVNNEILKMAVDVHRTLTHGMSCP
ncbi:MAG: hypothetical protein OXF66_05150 [Gammaproteobacteria bacterium]|nr:hypothetical protein [Gammaproteobacteria bacterium]MCY4166645.1 hypothetical protein [Gammaproteobacteria bacterium]